MVQFIKFGSACLFNERKEIDYDTLSARATEIKEHYQDTAILVSGAIALGRMKRREARKKESLTPVEIQSLASVGQIELMKVYEQIFGTDIAQLLLTEEDMKHPNHIRDLISYNIDQRIITLINYNDCVDFEELMLDNDLLAARLSLYCNAARLVILGRGYDGLMDHDGHLITRVSTIDDALYTMCNGKSEHGNGGFKTKLEAAQMLLNAGKEMIVGNVKYSLTGIIEGKVDRTLFRQDPVI